MYQYIQLTYNDVLQKEELYEHICSIHNAVRLSPTRIVISHNSIDDTIVLLSYNTSSGKALKVGNMRYRNANFNIVNGRNVISVEIMLDTIMHGMFHLILVCFCSIVTISCHICIFM
jgi:hypothetical protein